jgi:outer membrane receptor protein involved in Fe transport
MSSVNLFNPIKVNPFTFEPQEAGLELTPLRAYAHQVPHYYVQSFGPLATLPDTNEYAGFIQDTIRVSDHFALSLVARYDLQSFTTKDTGNVAPRVGLAYFIGNERPLVIRAGTRPDHAGWFHQQRGPVRLDG